MRAMQLSGSKGSQAYSLAILAQANQVTTHRMHPRWWYVKSILLASAKDSGTSLAVLATDIDMDSAPPDYFMQCVVVLRSSRIAFLGTLESPAGPDDEAKMFE